MQNLSSLPVTKVKEHLLANGPNFAITLKCPSNGEYIAMVEQAYILFAMSREMLTANVGGSYHGGK